MRNLEKNKRPIAWVNYKGIEDIRDGNGNLTGEKKVMYFPLTERKASVSGARGGTLIEVFGTEIKYDKAVLIEKKDKQSSRNPKDCIDENTVFFIDTKPAFDESGNPLYDYRVKRIAETLNQIVIALEKVKKNG